MSPLEIALLDALRSALRVRDLRAKHTRAGPLTQKEARRRLLSEERFFQQLSDRALAMVDEHVTKGRDQRCTSSGGERP
jgi:hypothetical protein